LRMFKVFSTLAASLFLAANARNFLNKIVGASDVIAPPLADNSTYGNTE